MAEQPKIKWNEADFIWNLAPTDSTKPRYTWNDVKVIEDALGGGGVMADDMPWTKWGDEDDRKKRLVKLICKVQGKTITEEKEVQNYKDGGYRDRRLCKRCVSSTMKRFDQCWVTQLYYLNKIKCNT